MIPFNKPYFTGQESTLIAEALKKGRLSGNGFFTQKCQAFFEKEYGYKRCFLTNSATAGIEMASVLADIQPGDEVILPSFTFVATATPFALRNAKLIFVDNEEDGPNIDVKQIEEAITDKTKMIVVVHYSGLACDMDKIMELANKHGILVLEDAAHSITAKYKNQYLGTIGHFGAMSFHETKNISSGQGGFLSVNDERFISRAEKIWSKGTNRLDMDKGLIDKYQWVDLGSNYYPSEVTAAMLFAQLNEINQIQDKRHSLWNLYFSRLSEYEKQGFFKLPHLKNYQTNNSHIFYLICNSNKERNDLLDYLKDNGILAVFHYLPLHKSPYVIKHENSNCSLPNCVSISGNILRLPLYVELTKTEVKFITSKVIEFFTNR